MSNQPETDATPGIWTPSNVITLARILLVPVFVAAMLAPWPEWFGMNNAFSNDWKSIVAAGIFVIISCTDWLDGYLARSRNEITDFGKFMDPLADKILVAAALIALVELGALPTWVVLTILARDFVVSGVRMMAASKNVVIAASMLGKFKTVFQMIAIVLFTIKDSHMIGDFSVALSDTLWVVSWLFMIIALVLTVASMIDYLIKARDIIGLGPKSDDAPSLDSEANDAMIAEEAKRVIEKSIHDGTTLATAESLTGGMISTALTSIAGSSAVVHGGITSYVNEVKRAQLGVDDDVLANDGAVSRACAMQMAKGARAALDADIAVSATGIAGPGGAEPGKPVGTVWIGLSDAVETDAWAFSFEGDRGSIRRQTTLAALRLIDERLSAKNPSNPS